MFRGSSVLCQLNSARRCLCWLALHELKHTNHTDPVLHILNDKQRRAQMYVKLRMTRKHSEGWASSSSPFPSPTEIGAGQATDVVVRLLCKVTQTGAHLPMLIAVLADTEVSQ